MKSLSLLLLAAFLTGPLQAAASATCNYYLVFYEKGNDASQARHEVRDFCEDARSEIIAAADGAARDYCEPDYLGRYGHNDERYATKILYTRTANTYRDACNQARDACEIGLDVASRRSRAGDLDDVYCIRGALYRDKL